MNPRKKEEILMSFERERERGRGREKGDNCFLTDAIDCDLILHLRMQSNARCREENRPKVESDAKAWEPALHARARQVVRGGELGT